LINKKNIFSEIKNNETGKYLGLASYIP